MGLTLTVLGCSGGYAGPGNACSGYLVDDGVTHVWVDCGPGTLANLQQHIGLEDIDALVLSHDHPDHWLELPVLRNALKYGSGREGLPVYGTAATLAKLEHLVDELAPTVDWHTVDDGDRFAVADLAFRCSRTDHPVPTLALRVEAVGNPALLYTADTGSAWSPAPLGGGIGLALVEATLSADQEDDGAHVHLSGRQAGVLARQAGAARLLLTHLWPTSDPDERRHEAEATFGGPVEVAQIHQRYEV
ncbi:MAG: MBL fold metallo-hydrolase [Acidimicrobiales bacterium]